MCQVQFFKNTLNLKYTADAHSILLSALLFHKRTYILLWSWRWNCFSFYNRVGMFYSCVFREGHWEAELHREVSESGGHVQRLQQHRSRSTVHSGTKSKPTHSHTSAVHRYTLPSKSLETPYKWGFGQYWHESFLFCDNFALIRDNTNYENIFYYINSLYIEKTKIFDSSKYPPLAAITALPNLGIRAVSLFKHWLWIGNQLLKLLRCADPKIF